VLGLSLWQHLAGLLESNGSTTTETLQGGGGGVTNSRLYHRYGRERRKGCRRKTKRSNSASGELGKARGAKRGPQSRPREERKPEGTSCLKTLRVQTALLPGENRHRGLTWFKMKGGKGSDPPFAHGEGEHQAVIDGGVTLQTAGTDTETLCRGEKTRDNATTQMRIFQKGGVVSIRG